MRLQELVDGCYRGFDAGAAMADVKALCEFDRYQVSAGLQAAAEYVADRVPLRDVEVRQHHAEGRWWTFRGPPAWTPVSASLSVGGTDLVRYPDQPYALGAYSAACASRTVPVSAEARPGALVLAPELSPHELAARGAFGFVTRAGRVELPPHSPLVAFCVDEEQFAVLRQAGEARVSVELGEPVRMPVVTGVLPGTGPELLLTAHLCHPRPSANDNASGVAALMAVASLLRDTAGAPVRFVWGPEFVGTAAYLQQAPAPAIAVNVDMAGEDQALCGGPLVIERSPDEKPSYVTALAERVAALMPGTRSYSGAVPCDVWGWRSVPHVGASDHALVPCPSVGLNHWPDRFNHTRFDTFDKVSPEELRRTTALAASVIGAIRIDDGSLKADIADATSAWAAAYLAGGLAGAAPRRRLEWDEPVYDPWATTAAARRLAHRRTVAQATVASLRQPQPVAERHSGGMVAFWDGPFNLRALAQDCSQDDRAWLDARIAEDRGGAYARMTALARGIDGRRSRYSVGWWAALASELTVPVAFAQRFLDVLCAAGWAGEA